MGFRTNRRPPGRFSQSHRSVTNLTVSDEGAVVSLDAQYASSSEVIIISGLGSSANVRSGTNAFQDIAVVTESSD
jgi:hypothetical protein